MRILTFLIASLLTLPAAAQFQLMPPGKEAALRASIPPITDDGMAQIIREATLYTDAEMPLAYQFQPINGGVGADYTVFYSPFVRLNNIDPFTNGNREFPWRTPGGLDRAEETTKEFRFIWLPRRENGQPWPVVVYRGAMDKSDSVNMPIPRMGWRWIFPAGTVLGEVLAMEFSDGYEYTYEMRVRIRGEQDWDVEIYRPFPTLADLKDRIEELRPGAPGLRHFDNVALRPEILQDRNHPRRAFQEAGAQYTLPAMPPDLVKQLLTTTPFRPVQGVSFVSRGDVAAFAATAANEQNIVPREYLATFLGADAESCSNCHKHTLRHVDRFQNREWYGYIRGSDGIFSFHPVEPSSIGPPDKGVRLRESLVNAGMVAMYDPSQHPAERYTIAPEFQNLPAAFYPNTGRRTIRN